MRQSSAVGWVSEMTTKRMKSVLVFFAVFGLAFLGLNVAAQDWKKIVPLRTTCDELKGLLRVDTCKFPVSTYKFPDYWYNVNFAEEKSKWRVPKGTVTQIIVLFQRRIEFSDFKERLSEDFKLEIVDFEVLLNGDLLDSRTFQNEKKGMRFTVRKIDYDDDGVEEAYVSSVVLYPPRPQKLP